MKEDAKPKKNVNGTKKTTKSAPKKTNPIENFKTYLYEFEEVLFDNDLRFGM